MTGKFILAIDPANESSAFCLLNPDLKPVAFAKLENELMYAEMCDAIVKHVPAESIDSGLAVVIEWMQSYGMPVGQSVFETCAWIGRLEERLKDFKPVRITRKQEATTICHSARANDATIKQALIDRFAPNVPNYGKGSKKSPGWFYGFRADVWQAYAVGITYHDLYLERE